MKIRIKKSRPKGYRVKVIDRSRSVRLSKALIRTSERKRRQELDKRGKKPSSRPIQVTVVSPAKKTPEVPKPTTTVKISMPLSKAGNLRGMHNSQDSERMQQVRAMRKIYNKRMPVPQCSTCAFSQTCPQFKAGFECAFLPFLGSHEVKNVDDLLHYMKDLIASNFRRAQMATALETLSGGAPSLELSESLMMLFNMTRDLHEIMANDEASVDVETNDSSIIGKLFGGVGALLGDTEDAIKNPLDSVMPGEDETPASRLGDGFDDIQATINHEVMAEVDKTELYKIKKRMKSKTDSAKAMPSISATKVTTR